MTARLSLAALLLALPGLAAADRAGEAIRVQAESFQKEGFAGYAMRRGSEVIQNATLYTKTYGTMEVALDDGTELLVGPSSSIVIDSYVYDPEGGAVGMSLAKGALRVISGRLKKDESEFRTAVANIGVRGTQFWLDVDTPGLTRLWVDEGSVIARPVDSNEVFVFDEPVYAECTRTTCREAWPPPRPIVYPIDPTARR
ncbi:MAG: FecR domain-containing protein [Pikeienuella sp.]|uniref:FecR family protein n=1 Tax=Pikeienuella sp. TaxID=2831957 RepID=UPI00391BB2FB